MAHDLLAVPSPARRRARPTQLRSLLFTGGVIVVIGLGCSLGALLVARLMLSRDTNARLLGELSQARRVVEVSLEGRYRELQISAKAVSEAPVLKALLSYFEGNWPDEKTLDAILRQQNDEFALSFVLVANIHQEQMGWVHTDAEVRPPPTSMLLPDEALPPQGQRGLIDWQEHIYQTMAVPLTLPGRDLGWVVVGLEVGDSFCDFIKRMSGCDVCVVSRGNVISTTLDPKSLPPGGYGGIPQPAAYGVPYWADIGRATYVSLGLPLEGGGRTVGKLVLHEPTAPLERHGAQLEQLLVASLSIAVLLTGLVSYRLARAMTQPIKQAALDSLTGVFNRREIERQLEVEMSRAVRQALPLSVATLDLDGFKRVNDSLGHQAGDQLLRGLADFLVGELRGEDRVGRPGGDEFVVILPHTTVEQAVALAERLCDRWAEPVHQEAAQVRAVTISIGIAELAPGGETVKELLMRADRALYRAKAAGKNRVCADGAVSPAPSPAA